MYKYLKSMIKQMWHNVSSWGILQLFFKIKMILIQHCKLTLLK